MTNSDPLQQALKQYFGYETFRAGQREIIEAHLAGRDTLAIMPTGGGKSICFQLPALLKTGVTIVVSPLIALMQDQVTALKENGIGATFLNSTLGYEESRQRSQAILNGTIKLVYVAPERLFAEQFLEFLSIINGKMGIAGFAIDEAHCVSEWGHDFRPEYRQLSRIRQLYPDVPMIGLTATATERVREDISQQLQLKQPYVHVASFNRANLYYEVVPKQGVEQSYTNLLRQIKRLQGSGIVYCLSRKRVDEISDRLKQQITNAGFNVIETPLTEFLKAGGAAKCLTLRTIEVPVVGEQVAAEPSGVEARIVELTGHLLDSGIINRALDLVTDNGGSFQVLEFNLGEQRQSTSLARIRISAPSHDLMETIMGELIEIGAVLQDREVREANLEPVLQDGVAPDDFYVSTIYPTETCVDGEWRLCTNQRMDAAIAISPDGTANCKLLRDLVVGDRVVVGYDGVRTVRKPEARDTAKKEEFSFMGAGVSSERRVELIVEQIAWELRQIRDRGGKLVVSCGPVVVHTGGAPHLAYLIREGYVQSMLGGNAIAVHDMEQASMGTSLGVDLKRGISVKGGHRHHLKVINSVRRYGSIHKAVEAGFVKTGVMYECVTNNIPFVLAGSIRDDGPLPDTVMDLLEAQRLYSEQIRHADMILMLSSMLHSIGVGNMTPAGVKMVCVDINPAVVTKLSDRGSVESVGVVTDVGLFLSLLVQQLKKMDSPVAIAV